MGLSKPYSFSRRSRAWAETLGAARVYIGVHQQEAAYPDCSRAFIEAYGLQNELTPDVPDEEITLFANPKYRYGTGYSDEELERRFREDTIKELISYSVGCMMGRYSLDQKGHVYAHAGNEWFDRNKYKTFPALVYLHRYNEGTLSRMRTEYVLPLQGKITTRMEHLEKDKDHTTSTSAANRMQKEINKLRKQKEELLKFDEKLRHYADMKITLDLDDGVKVNYSKFGDLLAEVKAVTGKKE